MHPISALTTNQNALSPKLTMATDGQPLVHLAIPATINHPKDGANSFEHFFETDMADLTQEEADAPQPDPDISENSEREAPFHTGLEAEGNADAGPEIKDQPSFDGIKATIDQPQYAKPTPLTGALDDVVKSSPPQARDRQHFDVDPVQLPQKDLPKKSTRPAVTSVVQDAPQVEQTKTTGDAIPVRPHQSAAEMVITRSHVFSQQQSVAEATPIPLPNDKNTTLRMEIPPAFSQEMAERKPGLSTNPSSDLADQFNLSTSLNRGGKEVLVNKSTQLEQTKLPPMNLKPVPEQPAARGTEIAKPYPHLPGMPQKTDPAATWHTKSDVTTPKVRAKDSVRLSKRDSQQMTQTSIAASRTKTTTPMPSASLASIPVTQLRIQPDATKPVATEPHIEATMETRPGSPVHQQVSTGRSELPIHIARQLAEVVQQMPSRPVDITLSPEELGRVRLSVTTSEGGIVVNVLAERPETLDLMRRHIGQLSQEFQALGYQDIAFSFAGTGNDPAGDKDDTPAESRAESPALEAENATPKTSKIHLSTGAVAGLDLRL